MTALLSLAVMDVDIQREPVDKRGNDAFAGDRVSGGIGGDFDRLPHGASIHQIRGERADERVAGPGAVYGGEVSGRIVTLDILAAQVAAVFSLGDDDAARAAFEKMRGLILHRFSLSFDDCQFVLVRHENVGVGDDGVGQIVT